MAKRKNTNFGKGSPKRIAAAKKAARTRKRNKPKHGITKQVAEKANAAGAKAELGYSRKLRGNKRNMLILNRRGVPDIIVYDRGWKFYEVKPHKKNGKLAAPDDRQLNSDQKKSFKAMLEKGIGVTIAYYYRRTLKGKDKHGHPRYSFTFKTVSLKKSDFKRGKTVDPVIFEEDGRLISV